MNPLRLVAANYRTFDRLDLDLPSGCVAVLGENGAGKSSIVDAVDVCLFGPQSRSLADLHAEGADDDLLLELTFEHAGRVYRVRRTYSARGRGRSTLDLEVGQEGELIADDAAYRPLTCESAKQTQERLEEILGLSRETFCASAFLRQGDGAAFTEAQPRDRKRILSDVLGLDRYDRLRERAGSERRAAERALAELDGREQAARAVADTREDVERVLEEAKAGHARTAAEVAVRDADHQRLVEAWWAAKGTIERRRAAESELAAASAALDGLQRADDAAREAVIAREATRSDLARLGAAVHVDELEQAVERIHEAIRAEEAAVAAHAAALDAARAATQRLNDYTARSDAVRAKAEQLRLRALDITSEHEGAATCDRCGQLLGEEGRQQAAASLRREADALKAESDRLDEERATIDVPELPEAPARDSKLPGALAYARGRVAQARADEQQRARLEERLVALDATIAGRPAGDALTSATLAVTAAQHALNALPTVDADALERDGHAAKAALEHARDAHEAATGVRTRAEERLAHVESVEEQLARAAAEREAGNAAVTVAAALERAFSPDGIPALIVENAAVPQIEMDANRILQDLGTGYRVELRTQAALKSGDGVRDTLDVVVCTETGERPYETFSGGERTRLNLALRIALARLLAHRRGAESRLLVVDEPEFLDEAGTAALVEVLRSLQGDFDRLYLISHVPALRDSFDDVLIVAKDADGRSHIDEVGVFKAVSA